MNASTQSFDRLVEEINQTAGDVQRDRGTLFERLVVTYLKNEPLYANKFDHVWMLADVPDRYGIPKKDTGVDIVASDKLTGELTAVQAKFYQGKVGKATIDSFMAEMNKSYYATGLIVSTIDDWNKNAEADFENTTKPISRIGLADLKNAHFDWSQFSFAKNENPIQKTHKAIRHYQQEAIDKSLAYFKNHDRGQLIMAPGTGKTFTSLKIAESLMSQEEKQTFYLLYLVPSIQLLTQTLFSWNADVSDELELVSFAVTSDNKATKLKNDDEDLAPEDIGFPATTDDQQLLKNLHSLKASSQKRLLVVFSTYQSIDVIHRAQKQGFPDFDLIVADEAHRTTGAHALGEQASFTKVHDNANVSAKLRLYQTATPKIYGPDAKKKGADSSIEISSMDDEALYGQEIYRLGFGTAVSQGILTDYKVMVLTVSEQAIQKDMQQSLSDAENGLNIDDIGRIIGVWNAMIKRKSFSDAVSGQPMKRAIAFTNTIANSKKIAKEFNQVVNDYLGDKADDSYAIDVRHVDGTLNALQKKDALDWLADDTIDDNQARVLSNVKFLTEGIDVPNLDAVIFFAPKKSQVDIVQAVGRIMRRYEDKEYGYIILPIVIPADVTPETVLDDNKTYQAVWQVLNALRSTDERFNAMVNKLQLNKKKPDNLDIIGVGDAPDEAIDGSGEAVESASGSDSEQLSLELDWKEIETAIYGKIVEKVGNRRYLEDWSQDVRKIANRFISAINLTLEDKQSASSIAFAKFLKSLQHNINQEIDQDQAVEMLAQHLITKPVFQALFDQYSFVNDNPVSKAMEAIVTQISDPSFEKELTSLQPFYESVKLRAQGIDNAAAKQQFIVTLYDKFFSTGFSETTQRLGIVFTPVQIVDFIIKSVDFALDKYFGKHLADQNVHILDPFVGTGTFIAETLNFLATQMKAGKITLADITRKYTQELHANEIVLLSYYIAAINIEAVFDEINGPEKYIPFDGIVLTDTFESTENMETLDNDLFGGNNERLKKQQEVPITAIIANPPYSVGQKNQNDDQQNVHYPKLESRIAETYVKNSTAKLTGGLYDSYIKAFRWASDRIGTKGVIGFITNNGFIDSRSASGFRKSLFNEYNYLYIFNLLGGIRGKSRESAKKEGQNVFDIMTGVCVSILVKDGSDHHKLFYHNIGNYLSRKVKLEQITNLQSIQNINWQQLFPDINNDWINKKDPNYQKYLPLASDSRRGIFPKNAMGIQTNRDAWVYSFSKKQVMIHSHDLIDHYNAERKRLTQFLGRDKLVHLNRDGTYVKWTARLEAQLSQDKKLTYNSDKIVIGLYRPYTKKWLYYDDPVIERTRLYYKQLGTHNEVIFTTGRGASREFSALATDLVPNMDTLEKAQGFMRYNNESIDGSLIPVERDNVSEEFAEKLGMTTDETYAYVYGVLNLPAYQTKYANDLKKDLARLPILKGKEQFAKIGQALLDLHINYEQVESYQEVLINGLPYSEFIHGQHDYTVKEMKHEKIRNEAGKSVSDLSTIIYNAGIKITNIPLKAYDYVVNGKPAIEWILDQYQIKTDKASGIVDDPNQFSEDKRYIFDLLLKVINVSLKTLDLIEQLPSMNA
ncbi:type ISP restriction/modification enzyme [Oenococcus kitaharae]|uniref:Type III restriction enzyme, res subunit n=1 Tax=Oenococcus kitaharae DSM 17330 TaxID=1045004 RepID=G9WJN6_9LACO|nr:type ISP restriction/modification enzyme [Oenococcus kitaharae]EHN59081.1 type III restriction enzyme, res subunit [Oenococcus kitaharae DSM 17330]OEY82538.1 helicase [Oenococcus kitaharae]OEY84152.1 helicase [Oenococcus kitaharae]OEY84642.1 helicase [Oenococcus kitaharae]